MSDLSVTSSSDPVRVAIAGLGGHGDTIQASTEAAPNLEVVSVFDPNQAEASAAAERFGCPIAESYEAMIETDGLEAVVLVTPNQLHRDQTEKAVAAGLHVFVEKPIANTVEDGRAMIAAAEAADRLLVVGHNLRFSPSMLVAKNALEDGTIGDLLTIEIHFSSDRGLTMDHSTWRFTPEQCPMLPVMQLGIHAIDFAHFMFGPVTRVFAQERSVVLPNGVVDATATSFCMEGGQIGTMVSNYASPVRFEFRLSGTKGSVTSGLTDALLEPMGEPAQPMSFLERGRESYDLQMVDFGNAVRGAGFEGSDGWSGLQALAVVEAMERSVDTLSAVDVDILRHSLSA